MSNKRPLSPELTNGLSNDNNIRSLKRFKLHSIIQELRNEEANLVLLKKLRACQQLATRTNNNNNNNNNNSATTKTTTATPVNGFHPTVAARVSTTKPTTPIPSSIKSIQQPLSSATRKPTNPPLTTKIPTPVPGKTSSSSSAIYTLEERKTQAKKTLRNQLERDLLNIPAPKPLLQDISFVPNPNSLEFQPYIGLEDVVQCLYELQTERQRLPQRFTDRAQIDEPYICDHCGTDYTIRWWKHLNNSQQTNILCDRCKKQVTRRTLKSEHSTLLKNVFVLAMEQEKEIEKTFQALIKQQQKVAARTPPAPVPSSKPVTNNRPITQQLPPQTVLSSVAALPQFNHNHHQQHHHQSHPKPKTKVPSVPQAHNFATKLSQQSAPPSSNAVRKSNVVAQPQINRTPQSSKTPMPAHQQQQYRSASALPQQTKSNNPMMKLPKTAMRQQQQPPPSVVSSRALFPPVGGMIPPSNLHPSIPSSLNIRPTATKRRTLPPVNMK